jgi:gamma-glutamylcyclotransferase (GGCT)/AIG2-like uncharacterized protein YtfP
MTATVELFVNGTLMRGDVLHRNLDGSRFISEARTAERYRLFSIGDVHPGMVEARGTPGVAVAGELYEHDLEHLERLVAGEPPGLGIAVVELEDGTRSLGVFWVASELPETAIDISEHGDWRVYRSAAAGRQVRRAPAQRPPMKRLEGRFSGPLTVHQDTSFHGKIEGDLRVAPGVVCLVHGMVAGDLHIGTGSVVELRGMVAGSATNLGRLEVYGVVRGPIHDEGDGETRMVDLRGRVGA